MTTAARLLGSRYQLIELIGSGAMGQVWRAEDRETHETVAAKVLRAEFADDPEIVGRFIQERRILLTLDHPNIVRVHDLVVEGSSLAMVMDLVDGPDLRQRLKAVHTLPPGEAVRLSVEVLEALAAAHAHGVLHRDVKPENVLLDELHEPVAAKLTDFSIARLAQETTVKMTGVLGTAEYIAPEVFTGDDAGRSVDVYGAGILLYELIAGRTPFSGAGNDFAVANRHVNVAPPKIDGIPQELWELVSAMLSKEAVARPTADEAAAALRQLAPRLAGLVALEPMGTPASWDDRGQDMPNVTVRGSSSQDSLHSDPLATNIRGHRKADSAQARPAEGLAAPLFDDESTDEDGRGATAHIARRRVRSTAVDVEEVEARPREVGLLAGITPKVKLLICGVATTLLVLVLLVTLSGGGTGTSGIRAAANSATYSKDDASLTSGLEVSRSMIVGSDGTAALTVKYGGGNAGDFLEVLPLDADQCDSVSVERGSREATLAPACAFTMLGPSGILSFSIPAKYRSDPQTFVDATSQATRDELTKLTCTTAPTYLAQDYTGASVVAQQSGGDISVDVVAQTTGCSSGVTVFTTTGGVGMNPDYLKQATGGEVYSFTGSCIDDGNVLWGGKDSPTQFTVKTPSTECGIEVTGFPGATGWAGSIS